MERFATPGGERAAQRDEQAGGLAEGMCGEDWRLRAEDLVLLDFAPPGRRDVIDTEL